MAGGLQNTSSVNQHTFDKSIQKDVNDFHQSPNVWVHARNAINNSKTGDLGKIGNEPANIHCVDTPYQVIGVIHLEADRSVIFSTDGINSEIGLYVENCCKYRTVVNAKCLNFSADFLIKGVSRATGNCNFEIYWDDGLNPSRVMPVVDDNLCDPAAIDSNIWSNPNSPIPWIQVDTTPLGPCHIFVNTPALDCTKIRVAKLINTPCIQAIKGLGGGTLLNGSYLVAIAYAIGGQKISDYYVSNIQSLFDHENSASSLDVEILSMDTRYDEIIVILISIINQQTVARNAGIYSTRQTRLSFDVIQDNWPAIPIEQIPIVTPIEDKTDAMYNVGSYLLRVGPTSKLDFNYQPFANQILTKWVSVEYPSDYYRNGGNHTQYLRDEVYPFFIRWVYDTGDRSNDYHIPGRPATTAPLGGVAPDLALPGADGIAGYDTFYFQATNTAMVLPSAPINLPDDGVQIAEGLMGYWQSVEQYPDDKPAIWDTPSNFVISPYNNLGNMGSISPSTHNLCGKFIRHHKFPEEIIDQSVRTYNPLNNKIRILGVKFENVPPPVENPQDPPLQWRYIQNVVGYEILRGTRNGNKTIIAKGIINNMVQYTIEGGSSKTGLYPNYPYNDLRSDKFMSNTSTNWSGGFGGGSEVGYSPQNPGNYRKDNFTFHSPDTNFNRPFISAKELKVYGEINGDSVGNFDKSEKHPKEKLITDFAFLVSAIVGIAIASLSMNGQRRVNRVGPKSQGYSQNGFSYPSTTGTWTGTLVLASGTGSGISTGNITTAQVPMFVPNDGAQPKTADSVSIITTANALNAAYTSYQNTLASGVLAANITGQSAQSALDTSYTVLNTAYNNAVSATTAFTTSPKDVELDDGQLQRTPLFARTIASIPMFLNYFTEGSDAVIRLIRNMGRFNDFVLRYHSHCFYNRFANSTSGNRRRAINQANYIGPQITDFTGNTRINNLYRINTVAINIAGNISNPLVADQTRVLASEVTTPDFINDPTKHEINSTNAGPNSMKASSHYAALKQRIDNQYGQLTNIIQVPVSTCTISVIDPVTNLPKKTNTSTGPLFGGDTYVGRYTEKNTFFYFYDWLYNQVDGAQLNYYAHRMIPFPRFWANFDQFETSDFTTNFFQSFLNLNFPIGAANTPTLPSYYYNLDGLIPAPPISINPASWLSSINNVKYSVQNAWCYLFNSGVRDFFVESEINVDLRDWGIPETEQFYDPYRYTDTKSIFDTNIIKAGNFYKYDQSLSISKLFTNYFSWGNMQSREYDPFLAETCFVYRPRRTIYSLPAQFESRKDNWLIFLSNNYYDFLSRVTFIKPVNKSGALILFDNASPVQFQGIDQLQTSLGTKLTIGDGGLFSQPLQAMVNADRPYEFASCQDRLSVINTPSGVYWISQNQGKIFNVTSGLQEISNKDLKWWFAEYLPYKLTVLFSTFQLTDNPVKGIGCQAIYDNQNALVYFTKKDYTLAAGYTANQFTYLGSNKFKYNATGLQILLGDPQYFEDASWTVSYDPKTGEWLGWHDWHPELLIPGKNTFMSIVTDPITKKGGIWIHNQRCDLYCNYYGKDYPFEIEYMANTPGQVTTLRSVEYYIEVYKYDKNCYDRFHVLDYNFDEAVVYNTEQCSGMLRMTPNPKPDPLLMIQYPIINPTFIEILFSKVENKYRFNQFWDITNDRGEYPLYPLPPVSQQMIWNTGANGYVKNLNTANLNYNKPELERKKFRHYTNSVFLRKRVIVGQNMKYKMLVLIAYNKQLNSLR